LWMWGIVLTLVVKLKVKKFESLKVYGKIKFF
jgi:hypothetical protein